MKLIATFALVASASLAAYATTAPVAKPDLKKGQASFEQICSACHGPNGNSPAPDFPNLAGQHPAQIIKQIHDYKSGKRVNEIMSPMAMTLATDEDVRNVAHWIAAQKPAVGISKNKELAAQGAKIYRGGLADRKIAACSGCHGVNGAGIPAQYPRVAGQYVEYLTIQLQAFRDGVRRNSPEMKGIAAKMTDVEMKAVAEYMASMK